MGQILLRKKAEIEAEALKLKQQEEQINKFKQKSFRNLSTKEKDELLEIIARRLELIN